MIGPSMKIFAVAGFGTLLIAALAYVLSLQADNERLEGDNQTLLGANKSHEVAMHEMAKEITSQNELLVKRDKAKRAVQRELSHVQRRLRDAQDQTQITVIEQECMESDIPTPVFDILREAPHRNGSDPTGKSMPTCCTLLGDGGATLRGGNMVGLGGIHERPAVPHTLAQPGPRRDSGIL